MTIKTLTAKELKVGDTFCLVVSGDYAGQWQTVEKIEPDQQGKFWLTVTIDDQSGVPGGPFLPDTRVQVQQPTRSESRYEAKNMGGSNGWAVIFFREGQLPRPITNLGSVKEAEAKIIAFALNTVVEDRALLSVDKEQFEESQGWNADPYDGPTEGIAPHD